MRSDAEAAVPPVVTLGVRAPLRPVIPKGSKSYSSANSRALIPVVSVMMYERR